LIAKRSDAPTPTTTATWQREVTSATPLATYASTQVVITKDATYTLAAELTARRRSSAQELIAKRSDAPTPTTTATWQREVTSATPLATYASTQVVITKDATYTLAAELTARSPSSAQELTAQT
jgi:polyisoprenoid-binding protein YceI